MDQKPDRDEVTEQPRSRKVIVWGWFKTMLKTVGYALFLAVTVVLMFWGIERLARYAMIRSQYGSIYPGNIQMVLRDYARPVAHYDYDFVPGVCLEYNINKGNRNEYANNAGFREPRDISVDKPADEFRIFLTGGSTAYGMGAGGEATVPMGWYALEYRETISHMMERILNSTELIPGKKIRVYNTAVWGYAYQHLLMRYMTKLRMYNPDMVISLDGANEIPLISKLEKDWNYFEEGQYSFIMRQMRSYNVPGLMSYLTLWLKNNTYLMAYIWSGKDLFVELNRNVMEPNQADPTKGKAPSESAEVMSRRIDSNIATVVRTVENYHSVLDNDGVGHVFALQPWFYLSKKTLYEKEKIIAGLQGHRDYFGIPSDKVYKVLIDAIRSSASSKGYFLADFSEYFDDVSEWVFTDWCHLTAEANYLIAKEISNLVKERFFHKPLTEGDLVQERKDVFFWDIAASGTIGYAPPAESEDAKIENIFSGYPGDAMYASKEVPPQEKLEVVIDLGKTYSVSRLRIVWADDASVPEEWVIETSADNQNWQTFVQARKEQNDNYSRWPGFEYYAAEPSQGQFLRYRPLNTKQRTIRLRLLSMFR